MQAIMSSMSKNIRIVSLFLLIFSVAISSLYLVSKNSKEAPKKEITKEKKSEQKVSAAQDFVAVIPFIEFDLVTDLYLILKFDFIEKQEQWITDSELPYIIRYFKTLFCFVISTKAP